MSRKILVAMDGSSYSRQSLDYLARLYGGSDCAIELLTVVPASSSQGWMLEVDPYRSHPPEVEKRLHGAQRYLREAREVLLRHGFSENLISSQTPVTSSGVAATIIQHAAGGLFDALLIGRRGMGRISEMLFGSVSSTLLEKCATPPLWIIDGNVEARRFLLAVHCSTRSLFAADHLGFMLQNSVAGEILLYHSSALLQSRQELDMEEIRRRWGAAWCDSNLDPKDNLFRAHEQILCDAGIDRERIRRLPEQHNIDASYDLLRQARKHECGTLVIGRRGLGTAHSVSQRTMQLVENLAAWIV